MKIDVNLDALMDAVKLMGAKDREFILETKLPDIKDIDAELKDGISVKIEEIDILSNGLLSYKGRQVLLYIQDHSWKVEEALQDGSKGKKYHVANCETLDSMKLAGRYDRYVAKNNIEGLFFIDGKNKINQELSGEAKLDVCKNCLKYLNYDGYTKGNKIDIFNTFLLEEFFKKYQQFFHNEPKYAAGQKTSKYPVNWDELSKKYKQSMNWCCENCDVDLQDYKRLLETHHINGVKHDNKNSNFKALCKECHSSEPKHTHMSVKHDDKLLLQRLRQKQ